MALPQPVAATLVRALEQSDDAVSAPTLTRIRGELPAYNAIDDSVIVSGALRNLRLAAATLRSGVVPERGSIWEAEAGTKERLRAGVPIEDVMAAFRISITCIQDRVLSLAPQLGADDAQVIAATQLLWQLGDVFSAQAAATYRELGFANDLAEQRVKDEALLSFLDGPLDGVALERVVRVLGLDASGCYVPFCSSRMSRDQAEHLHRALSTRLDGGVCLVVPREGALVGILESPPRSTDAAGVLALGPMSAISTMHAAFAVARRVRDATATHETGIQTVSSLGWRLTLPLEPQLAGYLDERYRQPLLNTRASADALTDAVRAYLNCNLSIPRAAAHLHVHVNTLRYRLTRFEFLTGRSLAEVDTIVEVSLLLRSADLV